MILPYVAIVLLVLATSYAAVVSFGKRPEDNTPSWIFPNGTKRSAKLAVVVCTIVVFIGVAGWFLVSAKKTSRNASRFLIPEGYVGWLRIEFEVAGAPPVPTEGGEYLFKFQPAGVLKTSSKERYGWAKDHYYYYSDRRVRQLPETGPGGGGLVWGRINGEGSGSYGSSKYEEFFVGTEKEFREETEDRNSHPGRSGPPVK